MEPVKKKFRNKMTKAQYASFLEFLNVNKMTLDRLNSRLDCVEQAYSYNELTSQRHYDNETGEYYNFSSEIDEMYEEIDLTKTLSDEEYEAVVKYCSDNRITYTRLCNTLEREHACNNYEGYCYKYEDEYWY